MKNREIENTARISCKIDLGNVKKQHKNKKNKHCDVSGQNSKNNNKQKYDCVVTIIILILIFIVLMLLS